MHHLAGKDLLIQTLWQQLRFVVCWLLQKYFNMVKTFWCLLHDAVVLLKKLSWFHDNLILWELISWELISWQVDLVRVDLMAIDLVRIDLVKGSHSFIPIFPFSSNNNQMVDFRKKNYIMCRKLLFLGGRDPVASWAMQTVSACFCLKILTGWNIFGNVFAFIVPAFCVITDPRAANHVIPSSSSEASWSPPWQSYTPLMFSKTLILFKPAF